jgi:hypothetical protein
MIKAHVVSDLMLFNNTVDPSDEVIPECDIAFVVGNIGYARRTMFYSETLCAKYPNTQFIFNMGRTETLHAKNESQYVDGLRTRQMLSPFWPSNLHYAHRESIKLTINEVTLDILCLPGYPKVAETVEYDAVWKSHNWYRFASHGVTYDHNDFKVQGAADVPHGWFPIVSTPELCRIDHDKDLVLINEWLDNRTDNVPKILVTAFSPIADPGMPNVDYVMYPGANPDYWIFGGTKANTTTDTGTVLYGNPGRELNARSEVLAINFS